MVLLSPRHVHRSSAPPALGSSPSTTLRVWCGLHHLHGTHLRVPRDVVSIHWPSGDDHGDGDIYHWTSVMTMVMVCTQHVDI